MLFNYDILSMNLLAVIRICETFFQQCTSLEVFILENSCLKLTRTVVLFVDIICC